MIKLLRQFAISYTPPEPGCEYIWEPHPVWGRLPAGQVCENSNLSYIIAGIVLGAVLVLIITLFVIRKKRQKKLRK